MWVERQELQRLVVGRDSCINAAQRLALEDLKMQIQILYFCCKDLRGFS